MFAAFTTLEQPKQGSAYRRIFRRLRYKINPPAAQIKRVEMMDSYYLHIRVHSAQSVEDELERALELEQVRLSSRLAVCAAGMQIPLGFRPAARSEEIWYMLAHILCNTAARILEQSNLPLYCRSIGIIDRDCKYPFALDKLVKYVPSIFVYTANHHKYEGYAEEMMEEYGAPVTFCAELGAMGGATLVLNFSEEKLPALYPVPVLSLCPVQAGAQGGNLIVEKPELDYGPAPVPSGLDAYEFYTALAQRCRVRQIYDLYAKRASCAGRDVSEADICSQILQNQTKSILVS